MACGKQRKSEEQGVKLVQGLRPLLDTQSKGAEGEGRLALVGHRLNVERSRPRHARQHCSHARGSDVGPVSSVTSPVGV